MAATAPLNPPLPSNTIPEPKQTTAHVPDQIPPQRLPQRRTWNKIDAGEKQRNKDGKRRDTLWSELAPIVDGFTKFEGSVGDRDKRLSYLQSIPRLNSLLERLRDPNKVRDIAVKLAATPTPHRAMRLINIASTLGVDLKQNTYEGVAHQYAQKREWFLVLSLVAMGIRRTGRTTTRLLNWKTRALVETAKFGLLDGVLEQFRNVGLKPNARTFQLLIKGHIRNRDIASTHSCITLMEEYGLEMDGVTHTLIASAYRQLGPDLEVRRTALESLQGLDDNQATAAINSLVQLALGAQDISTALHYLSLFDHSPGVVGGRGPPHQPPQNRLPSPRSLRPDSATFTMLIKYVTHDKGPGLLEKVSAMIEKMRALDITPDNVIAAAVVRALCTAGDLSSALQIVAKACQSEITLKTLGKRIRVFERAPKVKRLDKGHVAFIAQRAKPDVDLFNGLINGISGRLGINAVRAILHLMHINKVEPDSATVEAIISWLNRTERAHPRVLIRTLKGLLSPANRPNPHLCSAVIASVIRREKTWVTNDTAAPLPPPPTSPTSGYIPILTREEIPQKLGYRGMSRFLFQSLFHHQVQSNHITFAQRMKRAAMRGNVPATKAHLRAMLKRGMHPAAQHYAALLEAHANAGKVAKAEIILQSAMKDGLKVDARMFTLMIVGYGKRGEPNSGRKVFEEMVKKGIKPDLPAVHAVASGYYKCGLAGVARRFLLEKWTCLAEVPLPSSLETLGFAKLAELHRRLHGEKPIWLRRKRRNGRCNKALRMMFRRKLRKVVRVWRKADFSSRSPRRRRRRRPV